MGRFKPLNRKCKNCKTEFLAKREWHVFCSPKCRLDFWRDSKVFLTAEEYDEIKKKLRLK